MTGLEEKLIQSIHVCEQLIELLGEDRQWIERGTDGEIKAALISFHDGAAGAMETNLSALKRIYNDVSVWNG